MDETQLDRGTDEWADPSEQLKDTQHYVKELHIQIGLVALIFAGLTALIIGTFFTLAYGPLVTELDVLLYMFCLLVGPAALLLFWLHLYELYGIMKRGEKAIPLTLDFMYFLYCGLALSTMMWLYSYYESHGISFAFLSGGWATAIVVLTGELLVALLLAKLIVTRVFAPRLTHFFVERPERTSHQMLLWHRPFLKLKHVYYFRKKPDVSSWQDQDCFVRYRP